jgi:hypothetical protein
MSDNKLARVQPVAQTAASLVGTGAAAGSGPLVERSIAPPAGRAPLAQRLAGLQKARADDPPPASCRQCLYVSFFFDGTGNNMDADVPTLEHSNVARMFRAMPRDTEARGIFSRYIPGIGTRFPQIGDDGKGPIPMVDTHNGMGAMGQDRLDWAFKELKALIARAEARAQNPTNKIVSIRLAVFGFSRGATLARAFVRDLLDPSEGMTAMRAGELSWKAGGYPLSIEFMGLWDTVASVGMPMSANNVRAIRSMRRPGGNAARLGVDALVRQSPEMLRAVDLAFGQPGADPAPGRADGHGAWADGLAIPAIVKQCVHMVAAHEWRNSFPVDSVQRDASTRGANCKECVYPGSHSDVGGGYRPGESGEGKAVPTGTEGANAGLQLSQVSLRAMYDEAVGAGVPLLKMGGDGWSRDNGSDFFLESTLIDRFNHYMSATVWGGVPLGQAVLTHMRMYFAWRWYRIRFGRQAERQHIADNQQVFAADKSALERQQADLKRQRQQALGDAATARMQRDAAVQGQWMNPNPDPQAIKQATAPYDQRIAASERRAAQLDEQIGELQARLDTAADDSKLAKATTDYDIELLDDALSILREVQSHPERRAQLRPHYRNLIETYEAEYLHGRGLRDEKIIAFFDEHVHDSLAGFATDSTLPSDPRVIYVGGDRKLDYAKADTSSNEEEVPA